MRLHAGPWMAAVACTALWAGVWGAAAASAGEQAAAGRAPEWTDMELRLHGALYQREAPTGDDPTFLLDLVREGDRWERVWGIAGNFNPNFHSGRVTQAKVEADRLELALEMLIRGDGYTQGGRAVYQVTMARKGGGDFEGTFAGTLRGHEVKGRAEGLVKPAWPPAQPGEHPRVLFRKQDLAALKEKAKTPLGQAALAKMGSEAASLAFKYQLTGDKGLAEQARKAVEVHLADMDNGSKFIRSRIWGWRMEQMALAYDMCHDAWPEDFKRRVGEHLVYCANRVAYQRGLFHKEINWHLASNYPGTILYGMGLSGLALWGEKGPEPARPAPPFGERDPLAALAPDAGYKPGPDVPVVKFASGEMPRKWIYVTGFRPQADEDPFAAAGGIAKARPKPGDRLRVGDRTDAFRPLPDDGKALYSDAKLTGGKTVVELAAAFDRQYHTTGFFYTVIQNDKARWVRLAADHGGVSMYLAGVEVQSGTFVRLEPGLYPFLVAVTIGETTPWGKMFMNPRLTEGTEEEARRAIEGTLAEHQRQLADWEFDRSQWQRLGGADVQYLKMYELGRAMMARCYREGIGTGGFQASTGLPMGLDGAVRYASCHRTAFGRDVSPYPDVAHYLPYKMFSALYQADGRIVAQDLNGTPRVMIDDVYHETRDLSLEFFAALFPILPDQWKPAALWAWNYHAGVRDGASVANILKSMPRPYPIDGFEALPLYAFVNYPLQMKPQAPEGVMPRAWQASDYGYFGFRSGWSGTDEFLTQVYAKARYAYGGGRENAGTLRVFGLGQAWSHGLGTATGARFGENVVQFLEDTISEEACGKVAYARLEEDGSGVVTVDLSDVYAAPVMRDEDSQEAQYERYGGIRKAAGFQDSGITGLRSVAVDYSGKSGAPCLLVIVDRIQGGKAKTWTWQMESTRESAGKADDAGTKDGQRLITWGGKTWPYKVGTVIRDESKPVDADPDTRVEANTFTLVRGEARLQATFVVPQAPRIVFAQRDRYTQTAKSGVSRATSKAIFVEGADGFFCVITIQKGDPPAVKVEGSGLDAKVTIGRQTISFDGEKVVLRP